MVTVLDNGDAWTMRKKSVNHEVASQIATDRVKTLNLVFIDSKSNIINNIQYTKCFVNDYTKVKNKYTNGPVVHILDKYNTAPRCFYAF